MRIILPGEVHLLFIPIPAGDMHNHTARIAIIDIQWLNLVFGSDRVRHITPHCPGEGMYLEGLGGSGRL